jgi:DNA polymerase-3 subunit delta'
MDIFDGIIGQEKALNLLKSALAGNKMVHAYLFTGPRGAGKMTAAVRFAAGAVCLQGGCGICDSCRKSAGGTHPDIAVIAADGTSIKIDQIRKVNNSIGLKPFEGKKRVYIIEEAHLMTTEAANALLKSLEEPPGHSMFILTADGLDGLLPTIISRCQEIRFCSIKPALIRGYLVDNGATEEAAAAAAAISAGSMGRALEISETGLEHDIRAYVLDYLESGPDALSGVFAFKDGLAGLIKESRSAGIDYAYAAEVMTTWLRDLLVFDQTSDSSLLINADRAEAVARLAKQRPPATRLVSAIAKTNESMKTNASKELIFESALLMMHRDSRLGAAV